MPENIGASPLPPKEEQQVSRSVLRGGGQKVVVSLLIAGGFVWLLARGGLPLVPPAEDLKRLSAGGVGVYVLSQIVAATLRSYRWVFLLRPLSPQIRTRRVMGVGFIGAAAIFMAPLRMGELVRPYLLSQGGEVSFMQASGSAFAERVIDGLCLTLFTVTALSLAQTVSPLPSSLGELPLPLAAVPAAVYSATAAFLGLFVAMIAFYAARKTALRVTRAVVGVFSARAANWAASVIERLADGLSFLPSRSHLVAFVGVTIAYWSTALAGQWVLMRSAGLDASLAQAITTVGVIGLGSVVPAGPGMFGAFQIAGFSAFAMFFPLPEVRTAGAAAIFVSYLVALIVNSLELTTGWLLVARKRAP